MSQNESDLRVTIAGATGFVGGAIIDAAPEQWRIAGLSRKDSGRAKKNLSWRQADLFSLQSSASALAETDVAIYLVHSMLPSTRLFQGNFADADLLIADNFANACLKGGVKQIIYLGGLVPEKNISKHLASRQEVEEVFKSTGIPCTIFRSGMVAGSGGSSFEILRRLVFNLPTMILPQWTQMNTQVIYIEDLVRMILASVMNPSFFHQTIDAVNGEKLNYERLIRMTARALGKSPPLFHVPINSTAFSKLWVSFFGQTDYELVSPLIDSLVCDLPQSLPAPLIKPLVKYWSFEEMLREILKAPAPTIKRKKGARSQENTVRSIQRLPSVPKLDCDEIARRYENWLPSAMWGLIEERSNLNDGIVRFCLRGMPWPLLVLQQIPNKEPEIQRAKFHIVGGFLSKRSDCGWLEFRQVANKKFTLACIHEFIPTLPWYIYRFTQAVLHKRVMNAFAKYLKQSQ